MGLARLLAMVRILPAARSHRPRSCPIGRHALRRAVRPRPRAQSTVRIAGCRACPRTLAARRRSVDPSQILMSLLAPVSAPLVLVVLLVFEMRHATQQIQGFSKLVVYEEQPDDSAGTIA
jgi:hypothetical protein